jgi:hypothetical protein
MQPLHLPAGQIAGAAPADLCDTALWHHQGRNAAVSIKQVGLSGLRPPGEVLPKYAAPQSQIVNLSVPDYSKSGFVYPMDAMDRINRHSRGKARRYSLCNNGA